MSNHMSQENYTNAAFTGAPITRRPTIPSGHSFSGPRISSNPQNKVPSSVSSDATGNDAAQAVGPSHKATRTWWKPRWPWKTLGVIFLGIYGLLGSLAYLILALLGTSYSITATSLRTTSLLCAVGAKTIEISFVTVFVSFLGQALSRSGGFNIGELTMKNWVIQPGTLFTNMPRLGTKVGRKTSLGSLTLFSTLMALLYTTASDTLVSPKLQKVTSRRAVHGLVRYFFASVEFLSLSCPTVISPSEDPAPGLTRVPVSSLTCWNLQIAGNAYTDLNTFLKSWNNTDYAAQNSTRQGRIPARTIIDQTSYTGTWLEVSGKNGVNNATLVMPHAGLSFALRNSSFKNVASAGEYSVEAAIPNPELNVLCTAIDSKQLSWFLDRSTESDPYNLTRTGTLDSSLAEMFNFETNGTLNTIDIALADSRTFEAPRFSPGFSGRGPIPFNTEVWGNEKYSNPSIYLLVASNRTEPVRRYTLCSIRADLNVDCAAKYQSAGKDGGAAEVDCSKETPWAYKNNRYFQKPPDQYNSTGSPSLNFKTVAASFAPALGLDEGATDGNATLSRILTQLALDSPDSKLDPHRPSLAEALAVLFANILTSSSIYSPYRGQFNYDPTKDPQAIEAFDAELTELRYKSGATKGWEALFYVVLASTFVIITGCMVYFALVSKGFVTDWTEDEELLALVLDPSTSKTLNRDGRGLEVELRPEAGSETTKKLKKPQTKLAIIEANSAGLRARGRGTEM